MRLRIETFSRKRAMRRRQYHARICDEDNGNVLWRTSEGYNNRGERNVAILRLQQAGLNMVFVVDLDGQ